MASEVFRRCAGMLFWNCLDWRRTPAPKRPASVQAGSRMWSERIAHGKLIRLRSLMQSQQQSIIPDSFPKHFRIHYLTIVAKQA